MPPIARRASLPGMMPSTDPARIKQHAAARDVDAAAGDGLPADLAADLEFDGIAVMAPPVTDLALADDRDEPVR